MMRHAFLRSLVLSIGGLAALHAAGCGGDTATGSTSDDTTSTTGSGVMCPDGLAKAPNSEFCDASAQAINCALVTAADKNQVCGVALSQPTTDLKRSATVKEFAGAGAPKV